MRIGFFGTPTFALVTLKALHAAGHELALVVAQPDKPAGRGNTVQPPVTVEYASLYDIPTLQPAKVRTPEFAERIEAAKLDLIVVVAYGRILTPRVLAAPRLGCINVHGSLLPRWRGAAPVQWAVLAGDAETGVCTMQMEEGLDTGPILLTARTPIGPRETAGALYDRLAELGAGLAVETLQRLDSLTPQPQATDGVTYARMLEKADGKLDFTRTACELDLQIRGTSPWPGAFATFRDQPLKILEAVPVTPSVARSMDTRLPPGLIGRGAVVGTGDAAGEGSLQLLRVQLPGKKPVSGADFMNGARALGEHLT